MKTILKFLQFLFKSLAIIFSKLGAQYTYNKIFRYLMKYQFISIFYSPLKFIFKHIILFIKLTSAIIAILSLFNVTIIYYNFDIMNEINNYIINIINDIKNLIFKWFSNEDDDEISEPRDFLSYRKDIQIIEKSVQQSPQNSYWILPIMILSYAIIYYYNPYSNLTEILEPIINKYDSKRSFVDPTIFITGIFTYKMFTVTISWITGYDLNIFNGNDQPDDLTPEKDEEEDQNSEINSNSNYSPIYGLSDSQKEEYKRLFHKKPFKEDIPKTFDEEDTPKASTSQLPPIFSEKDDHVEDWV